MGRVEGKVAIVTGAASGIGRATAELLAAEGARVVVADLNGDGAAAVAAGIEARGGRALGLRVDVADEAQVKAAVGAAVARYGALHVLHNNAATTDAAYHAVDTTVVEMDVALWDRSMAVNLRGAMLGCKHAIPAMIACGGGSIINTTSNSALVGDFTQCAYAAAKAAVAQLTRSVATAFGRQGIRCNSVSPGLILTASSRAVPDEVKAIVEKSNLVPRLGRPEDLAHAVLFLASDESSFITGELIRVDGGQLAHFPHYAGLLEFGRRTTE